MEAIDAILGLFSNIVYYGMVVIVAFMFFSLMGTVSLGLLVIYSLRYFSTNVVDPLTNVKAADYYVFETEVAFNGVNEPANVWYMIDSKGEFDGVHHIVLASGQDVTDSLTSSERERIADIALHAWETLNGQS